MKKIFLITLVLLLIPIATADIDNADYLNILLTNSSGHFNITGDYANGEFSITPPNDEIWEVHRVIITIRDAGINRLDAYGSIAGGVSPGWYISEHINGGIRNLTPMHVQTNGDIGMYNYDITIHDLGAGDDYLFGRWTFSKGGEPIYLRGSKGDKIDLHVQGDYTGLEQHTFAMQGRIIREDTDMNTALALMLLGSLLFAWFVRKRLAQMLGNMLIITIGSLVLYNSGTANFTLQALGFMILITGVIMLVMDLLKPIVGQMRDKPWF